jgi:hypothetical protein
VAFGITGIVLTALLLFAIAYWGFSFKSTGGVTRDPIYQFDISTAAEFSRDTPQNFDIFTKILVFFLFQAVL